MEDEALLVRFVAGEQVDFIFLLFYFHLRDPERLKARQHLNTPWTRACKV